MKLFRHISIVIAGSFVLYFLVSLSSCQDDEIIPGRQNDYNGYFPLSAGYWIEYNADSIVHLDIDDPYNLDTAVRIYTFQIREEMDSTFIDAEGKPAWRVSRYRRPDSGYPWTFMNLWIAGMNSTSAQRVEDNIRFIKLSFPLDPRTTWNGNAYNSYPVEDYAYEDIHYPGTVNSLDFDSTITIIQNDFISSINRIDKKEIYAKNVGMVYKVLDSLNTVNLPNGSTVILNGTEYKLEIRDYKK